MDIRGEEKSRRIRVPFLVWTTASPSFVAYALALIRQAFLDDATELALQASSVTVPSGQEVSRNLR